MPIPGLPIEGVLLLKEVADFIQIGLVSYQTGKRFSQSRTGRGGSVGIDGGTVRVSVGGAQFVLPIEDAGGIAGVPGGAPRVARPPAERTRPPLPDPVEAVTGVGRFFNDLTEELKDLSIPERALALSVAPYSAVAVARSLNRPTPEGLQAAAAGPNMDQSPFGLREFVFVQEYGKDRRQQQAISAEQALDAQKGLRTERLAAIDAQIEREKILAQRDLSRERIVARLEEQRRQVEADFAAQERRLETQLTIAREGHDADERQLGQRFGYQRSLQEADQNWKTDEAQRDRQWRADQARIGEDWGYYWKNAAADRALSRSVEAAVQISRVLRDIPGPTKAVVDFAQAFSRGVS